MVTIEGGRECASQLGWWSALLPTYARYKTDNTRVQTHRSVVILIFVVRMYLAYILHCSLPFPSLLARSSSPQVVALRPYTLPL